MAGFLLQVSVLTETKKTPLYEWHVARGAKMTEFAGYALPLFYLSQMDEHLVVRQKAGIFDISHMQPVDIEGSGARDFLRYVLAGDVETLKLKKGFYTVMLNAHGGIIDDTIVYRLKDNHYRLIANAACADKDLQWLKAQSSGFAVQISPLRDYVMMAIQGPKAREQTAAITGENWLLQLPRFACQEHHFMAARTGYTGEDGFEIIATLDSGQALWQKLADVIQPCGLGARDSLRLEAGLNLYGLDMDEHITPFECGLKWVVHLNDRDFIGKNALQRHQAKAKRMGLVLSKGMMRPGQKVLHEKGEGVITSASFSPILKQSIALARLPLTAKTNDPVEVMIRDKKHLALVVRPPFIQMQSGE